MTDKPTLVASYCFPPYNDTSAVVAAKRVRQTGDPVDVVANAMDAIRRKDDSLTTICGDLVRRYAALPTPSAFSAWKSITQFAEQGYRTAMRWQDEQGHYEKVYSRAQFAASHFLAARFKVANPSVAWTAEFSDPLSHDVLGGERTAPMEPTPLANLLTEAIEDAGFSAPPGQNSLSLCETTAFALASEIIFTNPLQRDFMLEHCHDQRLADRAREIAVVKPHPTLPREYYSIVESEYQVDESKVNIGYFGNFYANRGVDMLVDALAALRPEDRDRLALHIFTSAGAGEQLQQLVERRELGGQILVQPYADFLAFLNLCDRMDLLLVNDAITPPGGSVNPFLPSKWSDYKGSTTPVWALVEEGSCLDTNDEVDLKTPVEHFTAYTQVLTRLARRGVEKRSRTTTEENA